jgi:hypothetical protein
LDGSSGGTVGARCAASAGSLRLCRCCFVPGGGGEDDGGGGGGFGLLLGCGDVSDSLSEAEESPPYETRVRFMHLTSRESNSDSDERTGDLSFMADALSHD